jgi:hypothetical protein
MRDLQIIIMVAISNEWISMEINLQEKMSIKGSYEVERRLGVSIKKLR